MNFDSKTVWLIAYDICEPRRLARVRRILLGYGEAVQHSVFYCILIDSDVVMLKAKIKKEIMEDEDRVLFANLGPVLGRGTECLETIGKESMGFRRTPMVI